MSASGYQMGLPSAGMSYIRKHLGVSLECFASPLNCYCHLGNDSTELGDEICDEKMNKNLTLDSTSGMDGYYSIAYDVDKYFGSLGNFFWLLKAEIQSLHSTVIIMSATEQACSSYKKRKFGNEETSISLAPGSDSSHNFRKKSVELPLSNVHHRSFNLLTTGGSFQVNPPFVDAVMTAAVVHILSLLEYVDHTSSFSDKEDDTLLAAPPLSFTIILPGWVGAESIVRVENSNYARPSLGFKMKLCKHTHRYISGSQHTMVGRVGHCSDYEQVSNVNTFIYILQNEAGAIKWPVTEALLNGLQNVLSP